MKTRLLCGLLACFFLQNAPAQSPTITVSANPPTLCNVQCATLSTTFTSGSSAVFDFRWTGPGGFSSLQEKPNVCFPGVYTVVVTDDIGTTASGSITLSNCAPLTVAINGPLLLCPGGVDFLTAVVPANGGIPPYSFQWSNGTVGQTMTIIQPGTYSVTVVDESGDTASASISVGLLPFAGGQIISDANLPCNSDSIAPGQSFCQKVCPFTTVTYTAVLYGGTAQPPGSVQWEVSGAQSYSIDNHSITVTWGPPGSGFVQVFGTQLNCPFEGAQCVTIIEAPRAKFSAQPPPSGSGNLQICKGQTVYFENQSTGADFFEWDFGNGLTQNAVHPQVPFNAPGLYKVQLIARSACLCADTTEMTVEVLDAQAPMLDCTGTVCAGETVTYTSSMTCAAYSWSVSPSGTVLGGGGPLDASITVQWLDGPAGQINLAVAGCSGTVCAQPALLEIPVVSDNAEISGPSSVCPAVTETYSIEAFSGTNFNWTLSSGGKITAGFGTNRVTVEWDNSPNPSTTHWLSLKYDNCYLGCGGRDSLGVRILSPFAITGPVEICDGASGAFSSRLTFNGASFPANWALLAPDGSTAWFSPSANPFANPIFANGPGTYRLFATPGNAAQTCSTGSDWAISVKANPPKPGAIFGQKFICPGETYTYEASGFDPKNNLQWEQKNSFAAPAVFAGNPVNVVWAAADPRSISVRQISTDGLGCASDSAQFLVSEIPGVSIAGKPGVCMDEVATYTAEPFQNFDYQWTVSPADAATIATGQGKNEVEIFWQKPGNHTLRLTVCGKTATRNITVFAKPDPVVIAPPGLCPGETGAVQTAIPFTFYRWLNDQSATVSNAAAPQLSPGNYAIEVADANGCTGQSEFSIAEFPVPSLSVTTPDPTGFCANSRTVTMHALVTADGDYTYNWLKDNVLLGHNQPVYTTNQYGDYSLEVVNQFGCKAADGPIRVFEYCIGSGVCHNPGHAPSCPPGELEMRIDETPQCNTKNFALESGPLYPSGTADWIFGESGATSLGTATGDNPTFQFPNAGWYIVLVRAVLTNGAVCKTLDSVKVTVAARFKTEPKCPGVPTVFEDISTLLPGESIAAYAWDFGDAAAGAGNFSSDKDPAHVFAFPGNYTVVLTVTAASGCTSAFSKTVKIPAIPPLPFVPPTQTCEDVALQFSAPPGTTNIEWNFGDPASGATNSATSAAAWHTFKTPGNFTVQISSTNVFGCKSTVNQSISIQANTLAGGISMAPGSPICEGKTTTLTAPGGAGVTWKWSDGAGGQTRTTGTEGNYEVTLTNAAGCTFAPPPVRLEINPAPDALIKAILKNNIGQTIGTAYPTLAVCQGEDVFLTAVGSGPGATFLWPAGIPGSALEFSEARHNLLPPGQTTYAVTVTQTGTGCTFVSDPFTVRVNPKPSGFSVSTTAVPACANSANTLIYNGPAPANWQIFWSTGDAGPQNLTTKNPGEYFVRVRNEFGCAAESNSIFVFPGPNVDAIPSGCHVRCRPDTLCFPALPGIVLWQWFLDGTAVPGANQPRLIATQPGTYHLEMLDNPGCRGASDPLTLDLFDGYGSIAGQVFSDVNGNSLIDAADTLVSGIGILLAQNGAPVGSGATSNAAGAFAFPNILSTDYAVEINPAALPPGCQIVIGQDAVSLSGCDDLETAALLVRFSCLPQLSMLDLSACAGDSAIFNGVKIPASGNETFIFTSASGCDSIIWVNVASIPAKTGVADLSACVGGFAVFNGTQIPAGTSQNVTLVSAATGCDSIVTVTVAEIPGGVGSQNLQACIGSFAVFNGVQIPAGTSQDFTLISAATGCDSIVTVTVAALPVLAGEIRLPACPGGFAVFEGVQIPVGTSQDFTLTATAGGCDSIVTVTAEALPPAFGTLQLAVCQGDSAFVNGEKIAAGHSKTFSNLTSAAGCDSVLTVYVEQLLPSERQVFALVCAGDSLDFEDEKIPGNTDRTFFRIAANGCDSVVFVRVLEIPGKTGTLKLKACAGDSAVYEGVKIAAGSSRVFNLTAAAGCDSLLMVQVSALPKKQGGDEVWLCPGAIPIYNGVPVAAAGDTAVFGYLTLEGCDSTVSVRFRRHPTLGFGLVGERACAGASDGSLEVVGLAGGLAPFEYSVDNGPLQTGAFFDGLAAGLHTVMVLDANGCQFFEDTILAAAKKLEIVLPPAVLPCDSTGIRLAPEISGDTSGLKLRWSTGAQTPDVQIFEPGNIWLEAENYCETVRQETAVKWAEEALAGDLVFVPNAFSPEAERSENSVFRGFPAAGFFILEYRLEVYDRWGEQVFVSKDPAQGWAGPFRARESKPAVFVWLLEMRISFCGREMTVRRRGDVVPVR